VVHKERRKIMKKKIKASRAVCLIIACLFMFASVVSLSSCFGGRNETKKKTFGITYMTMNDPFYVSMSNGIKPKIEELGGELIELDAKFDQNKQNSDIEDLIQQQVDLIFVVPVDSKGIKPALESCKAAGIPVVDVDTMVDDPDLVVTQVASDCIKLGKLCGEAMAKALNGSGNIIVITTDVIRPARDRSTGFKEVMKNYPGINIVQYQDAQTCSTEDALGLMENMLQAHPDINGAFGTNDAIGLGIYAAAKSANKIGDVKIVSFYDREDLVNLAVKTVTHNLIEGILLVTFIVLIFMADWRTTVIVAVVIPLALLFAFICLRVMGMSANLLSMGAIDFGIIIDGAVVMVEGVFVALDKKARQVGMPAFNVMSKMGLIRNTAKDKAKAVFFSKLIIITALIPIFSFQKVEGKMFSPLAYTLGFALLGALIFTLTLVPVMSSMLLKKNVREKNNRFVRFINAKCTALFDLFYAHRKLTIGLATVIAGVGLWLFSFLGTEFLPQLNEGSIYIRATLPQSISLDESVTLANKMRRKLLTFSEVRQVLSQTGRPNDGTDATGFYNIEFHVDIYPEKEWESKLTKMELIDKMQEDLSIYPGIDFNFSQPITDNVEEAASGVKGSIAVKVFGKDLYESEKYAVQIEKILGTVQGIEDLGVIRNIGQPELRIELNEGQLARYGVAKEDVQSIIEMAIGGKSASLLYEDERKFNIMVRYSEQFRQNEEEIGKILVPAMDGTMVPIKELADITTITGPLLIFRDNHVRFCAVKFSVRGRDMGTAVAEAQKKVNASVHLPTGYSLKWTGDFENQQRATKRLAQVVPISIAIIFIILFILFSNARDAGLVLLNVPFAAVGGIVALLITRFNFSISAGIGFIALFGICIQNGVIMISDIKANLKLGSPLEEATKEGVRSRIRPVIMTAAMAAIGLLPAAMSHGIGSESQRPLAIVIIGGLIGATFFALFVFPLIVEVVYERMLYDKNGKLLQRRI